MTWLTFSLLTVGCWGLYGVLLHAGVMSFGKDDPNRYFKAFLWVGVAYFLTAVLAPVVMLLLRGDSWSFVTGNAAGLKWSLLAGIVGAAGAFGVLLAFGAKGHPAVVMSIVFAGAPIVNAVVALMLHPPKAGVGAKDWPFFLGIMLALAGGSLVSLFRPMDAPPVKAPVPASIEQTGTNG